MNGENFEEKNELTESERSESESTESIKYQLEKLEAGERLLQSKKDIEATAKAKAKQFERSKESTEELENEALSASLKKKISRSPRKLHKNEKLSSSVKNKTRSEEAKIEELPKLAKTSTSAESKKVSEKKEKVHGLPSSELLKNELLKISQTRAKESNEIEELKEQAEEDPPVLKSILAKKDDSEKESIAKAIKESGLAWSAGTALFASIVFMMVIGWIIDTLFETVPIGIVVGIIIGSVIGFYQFFRITSRILK